MTALCRAWLRRSVALAVACSLLWGAGRFRAASAAEVAADWARLLTAQSQLVVRLQLDDPAARELFQATLRLLPGAAPEEALALWDQLQGLGVHECCAAFEPPGPGQPRLAIGLCVQRERQLQPLAAALAPLAERQFEASLSVRTASGWLLLYGPSSVLAELAESGQRADAAVFESAFAAVEDAPVQVALAPTAEARRVVTELVPQLPAELGGGETAPLAQGLQWAALGLGFADGLPSGRLVVQATDRTQAEAILAFSGRFLDAVAQRPELAQIVPRFAELVELLQPQVAGEQVVVDVSGERAAALIEALQPGVAAVQDSATHLQSMNNLRQIALALHNYHDSHGAFPPAIVYDAGERPLYSWRVLILPYLDEAPLFQEFHLDEPWDSEHNSRLIEKMPAVFAGTQIADVAAGRTSYLAPVGAGLAFEAQGQLRLADFLDGTSATILAVEVDAEHAVVWSSPQDLEFDPQLPTRGLVLGDERLTILFADGSVRRVLAADVPEGFHLYFTRAEGQIPPELP